MSIILTKLSIILILFVISFDFKRIFIEIYRRKKFGYSKSNPNENQAPIKNSDENNNNEENELEEEEESEEDDSEYKNDNIDDHSYNLLAINHTNALSNFNKNHPNFKEECSKRSENLKLKLDQIKENNKIKPIKLNNKNNSKENTPVDENINIKTSNESNTNNIESKVEQLSNDKTNALKKEKKIDMKEKKDNNKESNTKKQNTNKNSNISNVLIDSIQALEDDDSLIQLYFVRTDLGMGPGKIGAQIAHASVWIYDKIFASSNSASHLNYIEWELSDKKKIIYKIKSVDEMKELKEVFSKAGICSIVISDAGHTQIKRGSKTVLGTEPLRVNQIKLVFKEKLNQLAYY